MKTRIVPQEVINLWRANSLAERFNAADGVYVPPRNAALIAALGSVVTVPEFDPGTLPEADHSDPMARFKEDFLALEAEGFIGLKIPDSDS